jgi:hypothetical protein
MLEVCERFPKIGTIANYQALPPGEKAIYNQYTLLKLEEESKRPACALFGKK